MTETATIASVLPLIEVARATRVIREHLLDTLTISVNDDLVELAALTPPAEASDSVCLVFVGQYNAGKSSLITCLTGMELAVGSDVTTRVAETYPWYGHLLVDTPGVLAGSDVRHDAATDRALDVADAVIFVLTSEGFDERTAEYFLQLLARLRSEGQIILVVNKANSEDSDRDEILRDIRAVYSGIGDVVPLFWTEARDWLTADSFPYPAARRERSNVLQLAAGIDEMTHRRGAQLRLATPLRELSRHVCKALDRAVSGLDHGPLAALDALADETERRRDDLLNAVTIVVNQSCVDLAAKLIALGPANDAHDVDNVILSAQCSFVDTLDARSDNILEEASKNLTIFDGPETLVPVDPNPTNEIWIQVRAHLLDGLNIVARNFQGTNARPGGIGHRIVTKAWHAVGGKFKPWGAVKAAENVGKVTKFSGVAFVVGEGAVGVWMDYQSQRRASKDAADLRAWTAAARRIATETAGSWSVAANEAAHAMCDEDLRTIGRHRLALLASHTKSDSTVKALSEIDGQILGLLAKLVGGSPSG